MITKTKYPYIYFFMEPNIVFTFKMDENQYLTVSDIQQNPNWDTYEMDSKITFESFDHEEREPLSGRGYFINQDDLNRMVGEINKQIHKQKKQLSKEKMPVPVHITSSKSAAGSIRVGLNRPKHVIGFDEIFSIGPLWNLHNKIGQDNRNDWFYNHINLDHYQDDYQFQNMFTNTLLELEDISEDMPIYVWTANNIEEQISLRFILYLLKNKTNDIFLIHSTELYKERHLNDDNKDPVFFTEQLPAQELRYLFENNKEKIKPIGHSAKNLLIDEWKELSESKLTLRLLEEGVIKNVEEDYYDELITSTLKSLHKKQEGHDFIKTGRLVAEILEDPYMYVSRYYLEYRLRELIYTGILELKGVPKSMRHYSVRIKNSGVRHHL